MPAAPTHGKSLRPVILVLEQWGSRHVECHDGKRIVIEPGSLVQEASAA